MSNEPFEKILRGTESEVSWFKRESERHAFSASESAINVERIAQYVESERDRAVYEKLREWSGKIRETLNAVASANHARRKTKPNADCPKCRQGFIVTINPRNITFRCTSCKWSAIYPIRTLGNSERAERDEELDLIAIAEREVIENGRIALKAWRTMGVANGTAFDSAKRAFDEAQCEWLASVVLLESREAMNATRGLQPEN